MKAHPSGPARAVSGSLLGLLMLVSGATAQDTELREFNTDRPDTTESPFTVDRGHVQLELSFAEWTRDQERIETATSWEAAPFNVRWGITDRAEIDFITGPYGRETVRENRRNLASGSGIDNLTLRLKWNVWGNDGGRTAFALLPYVTLPTAGGDRSDGHVEGGIVLPLAITLDDRWGFSNMVVIDLPRNQQNDGYATDLAYSASLGYDFGHRLGGYVELASFWSLTHDERYRATFDAGLTLGCGKKAQFDVGFRRGITRAADDLALFTGFAYRF
jgi:hypothetical protein